MTAPQKDPARLRWPISLTACAVALTMLASACTGDDQTVSPTAASTPVATATSIAPLTSGSPTMAPTTEAPTSTGPTTSTTSATTSTTLAPTTTAAPTTTLPAIAPLNPALGALGSHGGAETSRLQQRLLELGFWLTGVDGQYGPTTRQAVLAFQKYYGLKRSGTVDSATAAQVSSVTARVQARTGSGSTVEIDKDRQVLFIVQNGLTVWAINTTTGNGQYYLEQNQKDATKFEAGRAVTPSGRFKIYRQRPDGWWEGDLGKIYRPKYFNGGEAMHGMSNVPAYPASHGCVRVSIPAMDMIWGLDFVTKGLPVWVYGNDVDARNKPISPPPPTTVPPSTSTTTTTTVPASSSTTTTSSSIPSTPPTSP